MILSIVERLNEFGGFAVESLQAEIDSQGLSDTGNLKRGIQFEVKATEARTTLSITAPAYIISLDRGAKPIGKSSGGGFVDALKGWAERKLGMSAKESLGFAIAYMKRRAGENPGGNWRTTDSIGNYVVPNPFNPGGLIDKSITKEDLGQLNVDLLKLVGEEFQRVVKKTLV